MTTSGKTHRRVRRGGRTTRWSAVWGAALVAAAIALTAAAALAQGIVTDKLSYQPGETVTITGEGWQSQEQVSLGMTNSYGSRASLSATAGTVGSFRSEAFVAQEADRRQLFVLTARGGAAGAEALLGFRVGTAPGSLRCSTLATADSSHLGITPGQKVICTIEQANDLSAAQRAGLEPVEVQVRSRLLGNEPATVLSVDGSTITFEHTAPLNAAGSSTVSYGPIKACDAVSGKCGTFPTAGNDANLSGGSSAAGFLYLSAPGASSCIPNLKVVAQPENGAFAQGSQASFTIVVSNPAAAGSSVATNVSLMDQLPDHGGLVWETVTTTQGSCSLANNMLRCSLGDIGPQVSVYVKVTSTAATPIEACQYQPNPKAVVTADGGLKVEASGALTCTPRPQLTVTETPHAGTFTQGGQATFTIVVSNPARAGAAPANNVRLRDELPIKGGMSWATAMSSQGNCWFTGIAGNVLNCSLGKIAAGASVTVTVSTPTTTPLVACTSQPKPAAVATADDGLIAQDGGSLTCTPTVPTVLTLEKTPDNGTFTAGDQLVFTYIVRNTSALGAAPAANVILTDQLPSNGGLIWRYAGSEGGTCSITNNKLTCSLGTIPTGGSVRSVAYVFGIPPAACTLQASTAFVTADGGVTAQDSGSASCAAILNSSAPVGCRTSGISMNGTSWNRFPIPDAPRPVVWVHAHIDAPSGIPASRTTTMYFTGAILSLGGAQYRFPDGMVTFDPAAPAVTKTTFNAQYNRWETVVNPANMSNEIFFTGVAIPVDATVAAGAKADVSFSVASDAASLSFAWQWSAAAYSSWPADWNQADINPAHDSYHAGAPRNSTLQRLLVQGPRGGAGSNYTGSWSSTGNGVCSAYQSDDTPYDPWRWW